MAQSITCTLFYSIASSKTKVDSRHSKHEGTKKKKEKERKKEGIIITVSSVR